MSHSCHTARHGFGAAFAIIRDVWVVAGMLLLGVPAAVEGQAGYTAQRRWRQGTWSVVSSVLGRQSLLLAPGHPACTSSEFFVYDFGDHYLKAFSISGQPRWRVRSSNAGDFKNPTDVQVDSSGRVWVADPVAGEISVFSPAGQPLRNITHMRNVPRVFPDGVGSIWTWSIERQMPDFRDADGALRRQVPIPPVLRPVAPPAASGWLTGNSATGIVVVVPAWSNRFFVLKNGTAHAYAGIGGPRSFPALLADTIAVDGRKIPAARLDPNVPMTSLSASVDAGALFILSGDSAGTTPGYRIVDEYAVRNGQYLASYSLPEPVATLCVSAGNFIGVIREPTPGALVWRFIVDTASETRTQ